MIDWIGERLRRMPTWAVGVLALAAVGVVVGGAVVGYRTYDYVEHDNEFCLSCHLMVEPYELFAQSAHRDLGCKACHKPTFAARSQMALTQIVENPDAIHTHAEVPNEKCASCHIDGDPDKWESISNSAGHRIHLTSDDPSLQGLNCVECHSTSLHQFAPIAETCAQSGCHEEATIQLGGMSDLTIHCTACHGFSEPVGQDVDLATSMAAVQPDAEACLSCHAMRVLVDMPDDEPHDASCGACHNPHEQATPGAAVESCATSACHAQPDTLSPMHRGLDPGVLGDCTECHTAHEWRVRADMCLSCHQDIVTNGGPEAGGAGDVAAAPDPHPPGSFRVAASGWGGPLGAAPARLEPDRVRELPVGPFQVPDTAFSHRRHRDVECTACHSTEQSHGRLTVTSRNDCRSCHHRQPVATDCTRCHAAGSAPGQTYRLTRDPSFTVGDVPPRALPFQHEPHASLACSRCHTGGLQLSASAVDCASCHEDHHTPEASCMSCHRKPPADAHTLDVHTGCSGSGCHENVASAIRGVPRTRPFCLSCHQDLVDHRPGRNCEECHSLPAPGGQGGG